MKKNLRFFRLKMVTLVVYPMFHFLLRAPIDNRQLIASEGATLSDIN